MSQIPDHLPAHVSIVNEFPEDLVQAMREFISSGPNWDHRRLLQAAVAGFLFQHGCNNRAVSRHYLEGLFQRDDGAVHRRSPAAEAVIPIAALGGPAW